MCVLTEDHGSLLGVFQRLSDAPPGALVHGANDICDVRPRTARFILSNKNSQRAQQK
jgi:hypothetical protein